MWASVSLVRRTNTRGSSGRQGFVPLSHYTQMFQCDEDPLTTRGGGSCCSFLIFGSWARRLTHMSKAHSLLRDTVST